MLEITAICHSQLILAAANIVKGRKCTAYPTVGPVLIAASAHWVEPESLSHCITDGNLVTGVAYPGHPEFIQSFVKALGGSITGSEKRILFLCGVCVENLLNIWAVMAYMTCVPASISFQLTSNPSFSIYLSFLELVLCYGSLDTS